MYTARVGVARSRRAGRRGCPQGRARGSSPGALGDLAGSRWLGERASRAMSRRGEEGRQVGLPKEPLCRAREGRSARCREVRARVPGRRTRRGRRRAGGGEARARRRGVEEVVAAAAAVVLLGRGCGWEEGGRGHGDVPQSREARKGGGQQGCQPQSQTGRSMR